MKLPLKSKSLQTGQILAAAALALASAATSRAQQLGWEGSTGVFVTPLAYTISAPEKQISRPVVAYHYLNGGDVLGSFHQISITGGSVNRVEYGYTRTIHSAGNNPTLSPLWTDGFNTFHAKGVWIKENAWKTKWMPQLATGFTIRSQVRNVGGALTKKDTVNGDIYLVASKTITQIKPIPVLITAGIRGSNAQLFGLAGNAPEWAALGFGSVAFVLHGPAKSTIILATEASQQPNRIQDLPGAVMPTTLVYAARVLPSAKLRLNVDFGMLQGPGRIAPGVDLGARARPAVAVSYKF